MLDFARRAKAALHTGESATLGVWTLLITGTWGRASWTTGIIHQPIFTLQSCGEGRKQRLQNDSKTGVKVHAQKIDRASVGVCIVCLWHTTELLGPPADVDPSAVTLFSIGSNGCTETLTVPTWVTAETHTQTIKYYELFICYLKYYFKYTITTQHNHNTTTSWLMKIYILSD